MGEEPEPNGQLVCVECGAINPPAADGWRIYLDVDGEQVSYCPRCAEREFGEP